MKEFCGIAALVFGGATLTASAVAGLGAGLDYMECRGIEKGAGIPTRWEWGCYVQVNGRWVPKRSVVWATEAQAK